MSKIKESGFDYYRKMLFTEIRTMKNNEVYLDNGTDCKLTNCNTYPSCPLQKNIIFLKTHKTGSETMAGIFRKFAIMNNVSTLFSIHKSGHLYQTGPSQYLPLDETKIKMLGFDLPGAHYEMITNHMTWNETFIRTYMPKNATKITILRNPATLLESSWKYYYIVFKNSIAGWDKRKGDKAQTEQLKKLLDNPAKFYTDSLKMKPNMYRHILRPEFASFGFGDELYRRDLDKDLVLNWIKIISDRFDLVLIMEYFDYSLALLGKCFTALYFSL